MTPGAPGTALPLPTRWALNAAARGRWRSRQRPGIVIRWEGRVVTLAARHRPYGASVHGRARFTHLTRALYVAWLAGRPAGQLALWYCGGATNTFELLDEPSRPLCPVCIFQADRPKDRP